MRFRSTFVVSCRWLVTIVMLATLAPTIVAQGTVGYYRTPTIHEDTIIFSAEGDLWRVSATGGLAVRLTTHHGDESTPSISPDGQWLAYTASYEGPTEVYLMALNGSGQPSAPKRLTFENDRVAVVGWTPDGRVLYATRKYATLPDAQLVALHPETFARELLPLAQASDGDYNDGGEMLFFTRLRFQGSHTRRYKGGTAQNLWKWRDGATEAVPLTEDYEGTSRTPMWHDGRIYFASDRSGVMNIWSMNADGGDVRQVTNHTDYETLSPSEHNGRIVYQHGADLWLLDVRDGSTRMLDITLASDFDQTREKWITDPMDYLTSAHPSPDGARIAMTARGEVFVAPLRPGRFVQVTRTPGVRYRDAKFLPDGETLLVMSDESGEVEFITSPASGLGESTALTNDGEVLRWEGVVSPDGKWIAHHDKNQRLWLFNIETKQNRRIDESPVDNFGDLAWSPDSRWLAYVKQESNFNGRIHLFNVEDDTNLIATSDRYNSYSPAWSPDGAWLYFLSDRHFDSLTGSPWGRWQPEPFFDATTKVYLLPLKKDLRSPFAPPTELEAERKKQEEEAAKAKPTGEAESATPQAAEGEQKEEEPKGPRVEIDAEGLEARLLAAPVPPGNYRWLFADAKRLYYTSRPLRGQTELISIDLSNEDPKPKSLVSNIRSVEPTYDGKKLLIHQVNALHVVDAGGSITLNEKSRVPLDGWSFPMTPREEWQQMFTEAWRLERDYFYDRNMHGVDWPAMREKYRPLVDRVSTRDELADVLAQMVAELSALHIFVYGGDLRSGDERIGVGMLGGVFEQDAEAGGARITHIYRHDPDEPERASPLVRPGVNLAIGDVIELVNGQRVLDAPDIHALLRNQAGKQVRLRVQPRDGSEARDVIVEPISAGAERDLRYHEWEYTRRLAVEEASAGEFGYLHLRSMGSGDMADFVRHYYPVFNRKGLIIDVRHNTGGNIDAWILSRLMRQAWFYWQPRVGESYWNMHFAFRGHMVILVDAFTASDGEAVAEGFRRLGLGPVIGTRTWGGEIWLSSSNFLVDRGIATAAEMGVYGPEGVWLIEGRGVEPDIVVDNLPHATFKGRDAQLERAILYLKQKLEEEPVEPPTPPAYPDKSK